VGAAREDFDRVLPLLQAMGSTIYHCGKVGTGTRTKLVNNYLAVVSCQLNAEALALSQSFGLDLNKTLEVINGTSAFNGQLRLNWATKVLIGDTTPGFTIDLAHKDLSLILSAANAAKVPLPVAAAAREMFTLARNGGYAKADFSAMVDFLCEISGIAKPRVSAPSP
jgi:4-hydroxybutyrate dehydrogenase / sulfolactaldehyde 3-reductase